MRTRSVARLLLAAAGSSHSLGAQAARSAGLACTPGNGVRHLTVAPNGDVFANVAKRGIVALRHHR